MRWCAVTNDVEQLARIGLGRAQRATAGTARQRAGVANSPLPPYATTDALAIRSGCGPHDANAEEEEVAGCVRRTFFVALHLF
mmetsp:Transcript_46105/g.141999  ORF Transcript_46105/g.141999 Transcript_46105/m.141999 type:complete len:83 (-) Transcript_46105:1412-1660(-)